MVHLGCYTVAGVLTSGVSQDVGSLSHHVVWSLRRDPFSFGFDTFEGSPILDERTPTTVVEVGVVVVRDEIEHETPD